MLLKMLTEKNCMPKHMVAKMNIFCPCPVIVNAKRKIDTSCILTLQVDFNHLKNSIFFSRISLLFADFS